MPHYRVHILDRGGDLLGAIDLDCVDDEMALERVSNVQDCYRRELWRLVAKSEPENPSIQPRHQGIFVRARDHKRRSRSH